MATTTADVHPGGGTAAAAGVWQERRIAAFGLTIVLLVAPLIVGFCAATATGQLLASWDIAVLPRFATVVAVTWAAHSIAMRIARHVLPLRALLRLSLVFPGQAPSRWRVGLRSSLTGSSATRLARLRRLDVNQRDEAAELVVQLVGDLSKHDALTRGHSERVRDFATVVGRELQLDQEDLGRLRWAALLHDIGKLTVDHDVLNKPGKLDDEEWAQIRTHPTNGYDLLGPLQEWLGDWALGVRHHHERVDGRGYPDGLAGDEIPLSARIIAVVDAFDVMTSVRSYKPAISEAEARSELVSCAGSHFDAEVVRAMLASNVRISMPLIGLVGALPSLIAKPSVALTKIAATTPQVGAAMGAVAIVAGAQIAPLPEATHPIASQSVEVRADTDAETVGVTAPEAGEPDAPRSTTSSAPMEELEGEPVPVPPAPGAEEDEEEEEEGESREAADPAPPAQSSRPGTGPPSHASTPGPPPHASTPGPPPHAGTPGAPGTPGPPPHAGTPGPPPHAGTPGPPPHAGTPGPPPHAGTPGPPPQAGGPSPSPKPSTPAPPPKPSTPASPPEPTSSAPPTKATTPAPPAKPSTPPPPPAAGSSGPPPHAGKPAG